MRFNKWLIILLVVLVLTGIGIWWWKSPSSDQAKEKAAGKVTPTIGVVSVTVTDIDAERIKLTNKVTLRNPLPVDIKTNRLDYVIYIDSVKIIEDAYEKPITIRSSDSSTLTLPMEVLAKPLTQVLKYFDDKKIDSADYTVRASFEVDVPVAGEREFTMNFSRRLPAFRIPKVKASKVDLNALALKSKGMNIELEVFNPNVFPLELTNGKFIFSIENALEMKGVLEKMIQIPAKGSQRISIHAEVTDGNMLKTGWKMLTDKKDTRFTSKFAGELNSENKMMSNSKMAITITGTLDEVVK